MRIFLPTNRPSPSASGPMSRTSERFTVECVRRRWCPDYSVRVGRLFPAVDDLLGDDAEGVLLCWERWASISKARMASTSNRSMIMPLAWPMMSREPSADCSCSLVRAAIKGQRGVGGERLGRRFLLRAEGVGFEREQVERTHRANIEHGDLERVQIDTLRRYVEAVGGALRVEVELGDERFQIA